MDAEIKDSILYSDEIKGASLPAVKQLLGSLDASGLSFGIVASRFNEKLTHSLVKSAVECLISHGANANAITIAWGPGAYEIPSIIRHWLKIKKFSAVIALGAVIQGETQHAELINLQVAQSLAEISREYNTPVINEVVSAYNLSQAEARCIGGKGSRGWYAARAAIEMARLFDNLQKSAEGTLL